VAALCRRQVWLSAVGRLEADQLVSGEWSARFAVRLVCAQSRRAPIHQLLQRRPSLRDCNHGRSLVFRFAGGRGKRSPPLSSFPFPQNAKGANPVLPFPPFHPIPLALEVDLLPSLAFPSIVIFFESLQLTNTSLFSHDS